MAVIASKAKGPWFRQCHQPCRPRHHTRQHNVAERRFQRRVMMNQTNQHSDSFPTLPQKQTAGPKQTTEKDDSIWSFIPTLVALAPTRSQKIGEKSAKATQKRTAPHPRNQTS